ncbi:CoA pyrophosphatase [Niallia sp. XMNu-256]|uniref:NUDIX hydrolase n=1 Tax=Niallia sp. XMNu-256 TaxID=3082444 RepID=UPI0030CDFF56
MKIARVYEKLKQSNNINSTKYSILLPLVEVDNETHILFEIRSMNLRRNPGQICFPGGKIEKEDLNPQHSAIRETVEELGIQEEDIEDVLPLDTITTPQNQILYLNIGKIKDINSIIPNEDEVESVFTVPLDFLRETSPKISRVYYKTVPEEDFPYDLIGGKDYKWSERFMDQYFYQYNDKVIWGLTARILTYFLSLLENDTYL